jgi:hypothetical protein
LPPKKERWNSNKQNSTPCYTMFSKTWTSYIGSILCRICTSNFLPTTVFECSKSLIHKQQISTFSYRWDAHISACFLTENFYLYKLLPLVNWLLFPEPLLSHNSFSDSLKCTEHHSMHPWAISTVEVMTRHLSMLL